MSSNEFDEYVYMKNKDIYLAQNFLTFNYDNKIFNQMLPPLSKYKTFDNNEEELSKFLFLNKIAKLKRQNLNLIMMLKLKNIFFLSFIIKSVY
jgi:hypothetical protein